MTRRRSPRPAAAAIRAARGRAAPRTLLAAVQDAWTAVVGDTVASVSAPAAERDGIVVVRCSEAVWAQELDLMQEQVLAGLRSRLGEMPLRGLRFEAREEA
jgi:predicted nucleic acid-binding Zn ribbon protein